MTSIGRAGAQSSAGPEPARPGADALERALAAREAADRAWFEASARRAAVSRALSGAIGTVDPAFGDVGPFRVITSPERLEEALEAVERAWSVYAPFVGRPDVYIGMRPLLIEWDGDPMVRVEVAGPGVEPTRIVVSRWRGRRGVRSALDEHFSARLGSHLELPGFVRVDGERLYRTLLVGESQVVADCLAGDAGACWGALGVTSERPSWRAWIRPAEYSAAVRRLRGGGRVSDGDHERCLGLGETDVCEGVLLDAGEQPVRATTPPPLRDAYFRMDLAYFAVLRGGVGAYERLQPTLGGDFRDRIGAAAQEDPDLVVQAWVAAALSRGVDRSQGSRRHRSSALLWYVLLAIPAARSSRWRLD